VGVGQDLAGKRLGLVGLGRIGARVARVGQAFDMQVQAWSQNLTLERCRDLGVEHAGSLEALMASSDFVSVHLVLSERTRGLIGRSMLGRMKPSAFLVNTSRGPIVEESALVEALQQRRIAGAALDVFDHEPLPSDHPLRAMPHVVATSHVGYVTHDAYRVYYRDVVEDIVKWLDGTPVRLLGP
jgi:phosphoglycerate dehydrogenase-like enzyme